MSHTASNPIFEISFGPLPLTSGGELADVTLSYELVGPRDAPVILVCHALTGNHHTVGNTEQLGWWSGLIGPGKYIDTKKYQVLTFNVLGGCDRSTGPTSKIPGTETPYPADFPVLTIRDMVHAQYMALEKMEISTIKAIIGGSLGGMQVMEWGLLYPSLVEKLIIIAATPVFSSYCIAYNHIADNSLQQD